MSKLVEDTFQHNVISSLQGWDPSSRVSDLRVLLSGCQMSWKNLAVRWERASLSWRADMVQGTG